MPTILLIRHARTATTGTVLYGRSPGVDLSDEGRGQAAGTAEWLSGRRLAAVYASPMERAQQTAAPIAANAKREIQVVDGINEVDFGDWTNRKLAALRKRKDWAQVQTTPSRWRFPGGESFAESQVRMVSAIEEIAASHTAKQTVAVVSHADTIKAAVAWFLGTPLDTFQRIHVSPASVTEVVLRKGHAPFIVRVNHVPTPHAPISLDDREPAS